MENADKSSFTGDSTNMSGEGVFVLGAIPPCGIEQYVTFRVKGSNAGCIKGCIRGGIRTGTNDKFTIGDKDMLLDALQYWIEDTNAVSTRATLVPSKVRRRKYGNIAGVLTNYTCVLLGGRDASSSQLRRLHKDFNRSLLFKGKVVFGSKYFSIKQWTGFWREWLQPYHVRAMRTALQGGGGRLKLILEGLWAWGSWVPGSPVCTTGCLEAVKVSFRWAVQSGLLGAQESLSDWVAGMEREERDVVVKVGGMIQIDPMNPPLPATLRDWLWESYPERLVEKITEASQAHEELVNAAVLLMEGSQSQSDSTQNSTTSPDSGVRRKVSRRIRPGLDEIEEFLEIASRKARREEYNAKRDRSRAWQATRVEGHYPAAYSISYLEGDLPPVIEVPVLTAIQRRALHTDPFLVTPPAQVQATEATTKKEWSFKEFTVACPSSNMVIGGTSPSPPKHHITVCTINANGMDEDKMKQLIQHMKDQDIDIMCITDTRLSRKSAKFYGKLARHEKDGLGPRAVVCAGVYTSGITTIPKELRREVTSGKEVGGMMFVLNDEWGPQLLNFKDDPTGLGVLTSIQLRLPSGSLRIMGMYWPVPGNNLLKSMRLEDKLHRWLHKAKIIASPRQYLMDCAMAQIVKQQANHGNATMIVGDFNCKWGADAVTRQDRALNAWAEDAGMVNGGYELARSQKFPIVTRSNTTGGNWIDHMLHFSRHQNIECVGVFTAMGAAWATVSDHHPLWGRYVLPSVHDAIHTPTVKTAIREFVELPLSDQVIGQRFAEELDKWLLMAPKWSDGQEAGSFLYSLSRFSTKVTKQIAKGLKKVPRSKRKDGWSPTFIAYKANLDALLEIRRHYLGQHGCRKWKTSVDIATGIIKKVKQWCEVVQGLALGSVGNNNSFAGILAYN